MRADCVSGHERVAMHEVYMEKKFGCPVCGEKIGVERIWEKVDERYRPTGNPILSGLQSLLDYEIVGVLHLGRRVTIEYPKVSK